VQGSSQIVTTNKPIPRFSQTGCPSCHPTNSVRALKGKEETKETGINLRREKKTRAGSLTLMSNWRYRRAMSRDTTVSMSSTGTSFRQSYPGHVMLCASPSSILPLRYLCPYTLRFKQAVGGRLLRYAPAQACKW